MKPLMLNAENPSQTGQARLPLRPCSVALSAVLLGWLLLFGATSPRVGASDANFTDAITNAMEAALPQVEEEVMVREEFWAGEAEPGEQLAVRHQMFRGNEYWFWLGTGAAEAKIIIAVYDEEGRRVSMKPETTDRFARVRVNPPRTGSYLVVFSIEAEEPDWDGMVTWALYYGFR